MPFEDGRRDVVAAGQVAFQLDAVAAGADRGAFLLADVDVGQDLLELVVAGLRADLRVGVQRVALLDLRGALGGVGDEVVVDAGLDQRPRRAGANLALVEREHREPFQRLVVEGVAVGGDVVEEDVRALTTEFEGDGDDVLAGVLQDQPPGGGLAGEGDLADPGAGRERFARFDAEAIDHVEHPGGQQVGDEIEQHVDGRRGLLGGLEHHGVAGGERGRELPGGHQQREIPRDDLRDHAQRLVEVVGDGVLVYLRDRAFLAAQRAGEVAEVVDGQRDVGGQRFAHRLAVLPALGDRERFEVLLHPVGDLEQDAGAVGRRSLAPRRRGAFGGVQGALDVLGGAAADLGERLPGDRGGVLEVLALGRGHVLATDEVVIARPVLHDRTGCTRRCVQSHAFLQCELR